MIRRSVALTAALCMSLVAPAWPMPPNLVLTGPERGTYIAIGRDLAGLVAAPAGIQLEVTASKGSSENVHRLRSEPGARLAMMQSDVYQAFLDKAAEGNAVAAELVAPLRVVLPLYLEEIYFVVRADSPMAHIDDIRDKRINVGAVGSGTALTATTVYRQIFGTSIVEKNASFLGNEEALRKLVDERSIDVVTIVAGQPAALFVNMHPEAKKFIKVLRLNPDSEASRATRSTYFASTIRASSYAWLGTDIPTLSMRALLVTSNDQTDSSKQMLVRFAGALCDNFQRLRSLGHAKWHEVHLALPTLGTGWKYYEPTRRTLESCKKAETKAPPLAATPPVRSSVSAQY
jgi:TRAP transporter TAXI family solute receptor